MSERKPDELLEGNGTQGSTEVFELPDARLAAPSQRLYLMVFSGNSATAVPLPGEGEVQIGRAPEGQADITLDDPAVSRHHAVIVIRGGRVWIHDLGSQNGTYVDGVRVADETPLRAGAVIDLCNTQLVLHGASGLHDRAIDLDSFRREVDGEIERAILHERSLAVIAVRAKVPAMHLLSAIEGELRAIDRVTTDRELLVALLPELDGDEAAAVAERLRDAASQDCEPVSIGYAVYPRDGANADALLSAARSAAAAAGPAGISAATASFRVVEIGEQRSIVADEAMSRVWDLLERIATADLPVLILGETGTGKELAASAVHAFSGRIGPLVAFNCAAIQDTLAESELFGHEKGAFSGARAEKAGLLETAHGGSIFLDEVAELSPGIQAKLLRALETHRFTRVGGVVECDINVRLIAATNRDLLAEVERGRFRRDLYFRLNAATVWLPPLRDRRGEIPILAQSFLDAACRDAGRGPVSISEEAMRRLIGYPWPGNIRELKNCLEFLAASVREDLIDAAQVESYLLRSMGGTPAAEAATPDRPLPSFRPIKEEIRELERIRMIDALRAAHGNQTMAAALIEMPLRTFVAKIKKYGINVKAIGD